MISNQWPAASVSKAALPLLLPSLFLSVQPQEMWFLIMIHKKHALPMSNEMHQSYNYLQHHIWCKLLKSEIYVCIDRCRICQFLRDLICHHRSSYCNWLYFPLAWESVQLSSSRWRSSRAGTSWELNGLRNRSNWVTTGACLWNAAAWIALSSKSHVTHGA